MFSNPRNTERCGALHNMLYGVLVVFLFAGCLSACAVDAGADTLGVINRAITTLDRAPQDWQRVANSLIHDLKNTSRELVQEVQSVVDNGIALAGVEAKCAFDFVGIRLKEQLIYARDKLLGHVPTPPAAHICTFTPDHIQLQAVNGTLKAAEPLIQIYGFNFTSDALPPIQVLNRQDQSLNTQEMKVTFQTPYKLQLNLDGLEFAQVAGLRIHLQWPDLANQPDLPILTPAETVQPRQAIVAVTFNKVYIKDDTDGGIGLNGGEGELSFDFSVNGDTAHSSFDAGDNSYHDFQKLRAELTLREGDQLQIYVNGIDRDTNPDDALGELTDTYVIGNDGVAGTHATQSSCPDGCYTIYYTIEISWQE